MAPTPKPGILDITSYVGGRAGVPGRKKAVKLSSNESPLGPSPKAMEALKGALHDLERYPEGSAKILREAIGKRFGLDPARIVCGGDGSGALITMLANAYLRPGDEVLFTEHAFLLYRIATLANSATPVAVSEPDLRADVGRMLAAVTPKTRLVYVANPNNPTGSYLSRDEMRRLHAGLAPDSLLVIDAAYAEYATAADYEPGIELVNAFDNVVMTRTFSKIYGLADMRVGWAYASPAVCDVLNRIRGPFNVSMPQQIVARAALEDREHVERSAAYNEKWRSWLVHQLRGNRLRVDESAANFVLIQFASDRQAAAADAHLSEAGYVLRGLANYGLPHCLRLTVGTEDDNRNVAALLRAFMEQSRE